MRDLQTLRCGTVRNSASNVFSMLVWRLSLPVLPSPGEAALLSSPPECRKTSRASWSDISIRSICSSMSTFTSMEDILPIGSKQDTQEAPINTHIPRTTCPMMQQQGAESRMEPIGMLCFPQALKHNWTKRKMNKKLH